MMDTADRKGHAHSILVVDDYEDTLESVALLLRDRGFIVTTASSGHDALDVLQAGLRPCLVLLDVRMPGMDGWTVWQRMQAHAELGSTPVVMLSGETVDLAHARSVGIRGFLNKPFEVHHLIAAVDQHCGWRSSN